MALFGEVGYALVKPFGRSIANLIPDVVVEETHQDRLVVTQHPVEGGGIISDHAYKTNPTVEIRAGWSDSSAGAAGYSRATYDALLQIQASKQLINVYTGKRSYKNMLPVGISIVTDERSENSLFVALALEQLTLTRIQTTNAGSTASSNSGNQASPESTGSVADAGEKQGSPVGDQAFAGAFNPGGYDTSTGGALGAGGFGLDGISTPGGDVEVGPITVDRIGAPTSGTSGSGGTYNIFEFG